MANIKSSKRAIRKIAKLTAKNKAEKSRLKTFSKKLQKLQEGNDVVAIKTMAMQYMSIIDKAGKHGVWHANKVNRMKSRLTPLIFNVSAQASQEAVSQQVEETVAAEA